MGGQGFGGLRAAAHRMRQLQAFERLELGYHPHSGVVETVTNLQIL